MEDEPRTVRLSSLDEDQLNAFLHEDPRTTTRELATAMGCVHGTIENHLNSMGKVQKLGALVPHELTQANKNARVSICASLLARHRLARQKRRVFFRILLPGMKNGVFVNFKGRKESISPDKQATPRAKQDLHPRKTMLCIWWDMEGIVHYELLGKIKQ